MKSCVRPYVEAVFNFALSGTEDGQEAMRKRALELKKGNSFVYRVRGLSSSSNPCFPACR